MQTSCVCRKMHKFREHGVWTQAGHFAKVNEKKKQIKDLH